MSISLVQSQILNNGANVLVSPNTAGNVLLVYALYDGTSAGTISVSDSNGNSYTQLAYHTFATGGPQTSAVALFVAKNINAGANTITLSNSQTSTGHFSVVAEYSGVDTTNPVSANQFQAYAFPPGTGNLGITIATALNNDKVALFYQNRNCTGITLPGGFTSQQQVIAGGDASGFSDGTIATAGSATYTVGFATTGATGGAIWAAALTAPTTYSISGNAGVAGATVTLSGAASASTTADGSGNYSFSGLSNGSYTVTPSKTFYTFSPTSSAQTISSANITGVNFVATTNTLIVSGVFQFANTAPVAGGTVSFTRRAYFSASGAQLLTDGTPDVAQLDSQGAFSIALDTFDNIVKPTPYKMVVYDAAGNYLMERNVSFSGGGTHLFNDQPDQQSGDNFKPQYASDTGLRLIEGSFGNQAANGAVSFGLMQQAVTAGVQIVPSDIVVQLDGSGNLVTNYLYLSAAMLPNTLYLVRVLDSNGVELSKLMYSLSETSPAICNLNDLSPSPTVAGISYSSLPGVFFVASPWRKN